MKKLNHEIIYLTDVNETYSDLIALDVTYVFSQQGEDFNIRLCISEVNSIKDISTFFVCCLALSIKEEYSDPTLPYTYSAEELGIILSEDTKGFNDELIFEMVEKSQLIERIKDCFNVEQKNLFFCKYKEKNTLTVFYNLKEDAYIFLIDEKFIGLASFLF